MSRTSLDVSDKHILHVTEITVGTKLERILHQIKRKSFNLEKTCMKFLVAMIVFAFLLPSCGSKKKSKKDTPVMLAPAGGKPNPVPTPEDPKDPEDPDNPVPTPDPEDPKDPDNPVPTPDPEDPKDPEEPKDPEDPKNPDDPGQKPPEQKPPEQKPNPVPTPSSTSSIKSECFIRLRSCLGCNPVVQHFWYYTESPNFIYDDVVEMTWTEYNQFIKTVPNCKF